MGNSFIKLKQLLYTHTKLTIPFPEDSFILSTDASGKGIGGVLSDSEMDRNTP